MDKRSFRKLQAVATQALPPLGLRLPPDRLSMLLKYGGKVALAVHWLRLPSHASAAKRLLADPETAVGVQAILAELAAGQ